MHRLQNLGPNDIVTQSGLQAKTKTQSMDDRYRRSATTGRSHSNLPNRLDRGGTAPNSLPIPERAIAKPASRLRVLIVDDMPVFRHIVRRLLQPVVADVTVVGESPLALSSIVAAPDLFDLIVTDVHMPQLSGIDLIDEIRRQQISTPVIVMTSDHDPAIVHSLGCYLNTVLCYKPIDSDWLLMLVRLLATEHSPRPPVSSHRFPNR